MNESVIEVLALRFGGRSLPPWYWLAFGAFAFAVVYADEILNWVAARTRKPQAGWKWIALECANVAGLAGATRALMEFYPSVSWVEPVGAVVSGIRLVKWRVGKWFGFE